MTAVELLHHAEAHGVRLWGDGLALRYRGNQDVIDRMMSQFKAHKAELLELLGGKDPAHPPLTDADLARLLVSVAAGAGLHPVDLWHWLSPGDTQAIRSGDPDELAALRGFAESRARTGDTFPGGHDLPFPGNPSPMPTSAPSSELVRCADCAHQQRTDHPALVGCGASAPAPGACGLWWSTDKHFCGGFKPAANRFCNVVGDDAEQRAVMSPDVREFPPERRPWLLEFLNAEATKHEQGALPGNDDDRRRCTDCANFANGGCCLAAWRGELEGAARQYRPVPDLPRRCEGYTPTANDTDQRPSRERWSGLIQIQKGGA